jgi:hypothetical protein
MNNKILSVVLVVGISATGFAGISAANETSTGSFFKWNIEIKELFEKAKSGVELTSDEQTTLDEAKANRAEKWAEHGGKRKGGGHLTDDEKAALESMSDDEKKTFFIAKKEVMKAQKEASKAVIDTLINGESLTSAEETIRLELLAKMEDTDFNNRGRGNGEWREIIAKILAGDELSADDVAFIAEKEAKHAEREAQRAIIAPIIEKKKTGEELTSEEQAVLDEMKENRPEGKGYRGWRNHK